MPIKMLHLEHGATHAYSQPEVESLQARGWTVAPPKAREEKLASVPVQTLVDVGIVSEWTPKEVAPSVEALKTAIERDVMALPRRGPGRPKKVK